MCKWIYSLNFWQHVLICSFTIAFMGTRTGFYGMDLYSFITSAHEVINYLEMVGSCLVCMCCLMLCRFFSKTFSDADWPTGSQGSKGQLWMLSSIWGRSKDLCHAHFIWDVKALWKGDDDVSILTHQLNFTILIGMFCRKSSKHSKNCERGLMSIWRVVGLLQRRKHFMPLRFVTHLKWLII